MNVFRSPAELSNALRENIKELTYSASQEAVMRKELTAGLHKLLSLVDPYVDVGNIPGAILNWFARASSLPTKGNLEYHERVQYWFRRKDTYSAVIIRTVPEDYLVVLDESEISKIEVSNTQVKITTSTDGRNKAEITVPVSHIMPIWASYFKGSVDLFTKIALDQEQGATSLAAAASLIKTQKPESIPNKESENMNTNKLKTATSAFMTAETSSLKLAGKIAAGNATNAVVKAALKPVITPLLVKALQPKGRIQRMFAGDKLENSIDAIFDSAFMDMFAAALLVGVTSSGMVTNPKLVAGAQLASDAAAVKLQGIIDFDALVNGLVEKITSTVDALEKVETV